MNENNQEVNDVQSPDFDSEEMKMPEGVSIEETRSTPSMINGPLLGTLTVILILILGGMYYWFGTLETSEPDIIVAPAPTERPTPEENDEPESTTAEAVVETQEVLSPSDEIEAIESDLEATDLESLDAELQAIENELDAALNEI